MDGASFLNKFREKLQQKREANRQRKLNSGNAANAMDQQRTKFPGIFGNQMNPASNGTGSARPNFGPFAQQAIGGVMRGQKMGDAMGFRQGVNDKLDKVLAAVEGGQSGNDVPQDAGVQPPSAPMPPADPMTDNNAVAKSPVGDPSLMAEDATGASMAAKPKQIAKAQAKAYADKKGIRGKARKELVKDAKRSQSFDAAAQDEKSGDKPVDFGGASMGSIGKAQRDFIKNQFASHKAKVKAKRLKSKVEKAKAEKAKDKNETNK